MAEISRNRIAESVNDAFANAPDYIEIAINDESVGCRMIEDRTTRQGYRTSSTMKTLLFRPSVEYPIGTYLGIGNDTWFIADFVDGVVPKAHIQKCNNTMKFINNGGELVERPVFIQNKSLYTTGVDDGRVISLPDTKISVAVPFDSETSALSRDRRFLFGYGGRYFAYKVTLVDVVTINGLALLIMEEDAIQPSDNLELGIADYDAKIDPPPSPASIIITGDSSIRTGMVNTYTADSEVTWTLTNEDGTPTSYASIIESSLLECKVKAGDTSNKKIVLVATSVVDETVTATLTITIKGLF